jgi:hypothetical protein
MDYLSTPRCRMYLPPAARNFDPDKSPRSQTNTSSTLSPVRSSGVGVSVTRAADDSGRSSRPTRRRSKDEATPATSTARPTVSALPVGVSLAGQARRAAATLLSRRETSSLPAVSAAPQLLQKRLSSGFSCRHSGQKARSKLPPLFDLLPRFIPARARLHLRWATITTNCSSSLPATTREVRLSVYDRG